MALINLPVDVIKNLVLQLDPEEIVFFCLTNKYFKNICKDYSLWQALVEKYFPGVKLPVLDNWHLIFKALITTREIEVRIDDFPITSYAGTIVISNITTVG